MCHDATCLRVVMSLSVHVQLNYSHLLQCKSPHLQCHSLLVAGLYACAVIRPDLQVWDQGGTAKLDLGFESCWHQANS